MPCSRIGSIASSGKPPLPQIARTRYWAPRGSVKRTIRALVVVPMQTGSYLSPTLRTPGAVWSKKAPRRSIGGSTPSSKIRICVRSRMPMMWPWTVTSSPARSLRISASSVIGNVTSCLAMAPGDPSGDCPRSWLEEPRPTCDECATSCSRLAVEVDGAVGGDMRARASCGPALVVDGDRVERADRSRDRLLGEVHRVVRGATDPDADDPRRARLAARFDDRLEHELLDPLHAVGGDAHLQEAHVLRAGPLRHALDVEAVPVGDELPVHDREAVAGVRTGVLARDRVDGVRAQRMLDRRALGAGL